MNISKLSISELVNLDIDTFMKLDKKEMLSVVSRMRDAGNKKLKRLQQGLKKEGIAYNPALRAVEESGGKFSTKGKNLNQLRSEYTRIKDFYKNKWSTTTNTVDIRNRTIKSLQDKNIEVTSDNLDKLFELFDDLKERDNRLKLNKIKYAVLEEISNIVDIDSLSTDDIYEKIRNDLDQIYKEVQNAESQYNGTSSFFN